MDARIMSGLIAGVRRAFPYVSSEDVEPLIDKHSGHLFRMAHTAPFSVAVQVGLACTCPPRNVTPAPHAMSHLPSPQRHTCPPRNITPAPHATSHLPRPQVKQDTLTGALTQG